MARTTDSKTIHYNLAVPALQLKATGYMGACGTQGTCTGYPGAVTCPHCKPIAQADIDDAKARAQARAHN